MCNKAAGVTKVLALCQRLLWILLRRYALKSACKPASKPYCLIVPICTSRAAKVSQAPLAFSQTSKQKLKSIKDNNALSFLTGKYNCTLYEFILLLLLSN